MHVRGDSRDARTCVCLQVLILAIWHHLFFLNFYFRASTLRRVGLRFFPNGFRRACRSKVISFFTFSLSCSQICTPYDSEEYVRIIPRKRIELSMARARYLKAKNIPDGTGYPSPYRKSMRNKEHIPRILAAARRGKDFPYESIT